MSSGSGLGGRMFSFLRNVLPGQAAPKTGSLEHERSTKVALCISDAKNLVACLPDHLVGPAAASRDIDHDPAALFVVEVWHGAFRKTCPLKAMLNFNFPLPAGPAAAAAAPADRLLKLIFCLTTPQLPTPVPAYVLLVPLELFSEPAPPGGRAVFEGSVALCGVEELPVRCSADPMREFLLAEVRARANPDTLPRVRIAMRLEPPSGHAHPVTPPLRRAESHAHWHASGGTVAGGQGARQHSQGKRDPHGDSTPEWGRSMGSGSNRSTPVFHAVPPGLIPASPEASPLPSLPDAMPPATRHRGRAEQSARPTALGPRETGDEQLHKPWQGPGPLPTSQPTPKLPHRSSRQDVSVQRIGTSSLLTAAPAASRPSQPADELSSLLLNFSAGSTHQTLPHPATHTRRLTDPNPLGLSGCRRPSSGHLSAAGQDDSSTSASRSGVAGSSGGVVPASQALSERSASGSQYTGDVDRVSVGGSDNSSSSSKQHEAEQLALLRRLVSQQQQEIDRLKRATTGPANNPKGRPPRAPAGRVPAGQQDASLAGEYESVLADIAKRQQEAAAASERPAEQQQEGGLGLLVPGTQLLNKLVGLAAQWQAGAGTEQTSVAEEAAPAAAEPQRPREYVAKDPNDAVDMQLAAFLRANPAMFAGHTFRRVAAGRYRIDGREVGLEADMRVSQAVVGGQIVPSYMVTLKVRDGPLKQPLVDYLAGTDNNAEYTPLAPQTALESVPHYSRISFANTAPVPDRWHAMRLAAYEASLREAAAATTLSQSSAAPAVTASTLASYPAATAIPATTALSSVQMPSAGMVALGTYADSGRCPTNIIVRPAQTNTVPTANQQVATLPRAPSRVPSASPPPGRSAGSAPTTAPQSAPTSEPASASTSPPEHTAATRDAPAAISSAAVKAATVQVSVGHAAAPTSAAPLTQALSLLSLNPGVAPQQFTVPSSGVLANYTGMHAGYSVPFPYGCYVDRNAHGLYRVQSGVVQPQAASNSYSGHAFTYGSQGPPA